ncbi:MAG: radical SAM protein [Acidimicrobiia bacterium]
MQAVLVASTYYLCLDAKQTQKMRPFPPLATLYVAAALREAGHRVAFFDAMLADGEQAYEAALDRERPATVVLYDDNFNFLSKMCLTRMRKAACTMAAAARARGAYVIVSGPDVTDHPEQYLAAGAHAAAVGEGDHTVVELVAWRAAHPDAGEVPGHIGGVVTATSRTVRANERHPDVFPHPARDLLDIEAYRRRWLEHHGRFTLNMVSTRGCPFHCNWCAKPIWGQRYAMRSPADVAAELAAVKADIGPDHIWFADDIFGLRASWLQEFGHLVEQLEARIPFTIQSRADLMTPDAVAGLQRAGCAEVWLGAESGSQRVLDAMDKGITVEQICAARAELGRAGIRAAFFVQFGYPGEDLDDICATRELVRGTLPDDMGVSVSYPLPGTRFHAMVADQLAAKANWDDSGDLDMMFEGTFTTPFYRHLHTTLHDDLDLHRRLAGLPGVPHPSLEPIGLRAQRHRVAEGWATLEELATTCRARRPTLLVRSEPMPRAPDLSRSYN